jgi:hypothetical protein
MSSPLVFTYTYPVDAQLSNIFVDASGSPLPGTSTADLITLKSPNFNVQDATVTLQFYDNLVKPKTGEKSSLIVENVTVIASTTTNTIGTLSWVQQYQNTVPTSDKNVNTTTVAKVSSFVNSASGIFANYLFGNVIFQFFANGERIINIYSSE